MLKKVILINKKDMELPLKNNQKVYRVTSDGVNNHIETLKVKGINLDFDKEVPFILCMKNDGTYTLLGLTEIFLSKSNIKKALKGCKNVAI